MKKKVEINEWVPYNHPVWKESEFVEIGGRKGHLLSKKSNDLFRVARIDVGDGWCLYKKLSAKTAKVSVEKVLLFLLRAMGEEQSRRNRKESVRDLVPKEIEEDYEDSVENDPNDVEDWFRSQIRNG